MIDRFPCPRCNRMLARTGDLLVNGEVLDLSSFQCDECLDNWNFDGDKFEIAFTFVVTPDGIARRPDTHEPI